MGRNRMMGKEIDMRLNPQNKDSYLISTVSMLH